MKYLKILGLAAIAATALMAIVASSASATALYSTGGKLPAGTEINATLKSGTTAKLTTTEGTTLDTCTGSSVSGKTANAGSATETVKGNVATAGLTWSSCTNPTATLSGGELEIHWISGTTNGTVTAKGFEVTVLTPFIGVTCVYTAGSGGIHLGTLTGFTSGDAIIHINAIVGKTSTSSGLCPSTSKWVGEYSVTKPTPLWVEES